MKELSIEEKAKAYDKALDRAKELLLKDLCARLPYDLQVKTSEDNEPYTLLSVHPNKGLALIGIDMDGIYATSKVEIDTIKPYLRTMDSMTEEEVKEYRSIQSDIWKPCGTQYYDNWRSIRWLYEHNFNVSLPEHLFIKVTKENNPYKEIKR